MGGSNTTTNVPGQYGVQGVPSPSNSPGSRHQALGWYDGATRQLWLHSGLGYSSTPSPSGTIDLVHHVF
jgi:hypothetical protein